MQGLHSRKNDSRTGTRPADEQADRKTMHPDDFLAHLTWVRAKQSREIAQ